MSKEWTDAIAAVLERAPKSDDPERERVQRIMSRRYAQMIYAALEPLRERDLFVRVNLRQMARAAATELGIDYDALADGPHFSPEASKDDWMRAMLAAAQAASTPAEHDEGETNG